MDRVGMYGLGCTLNLFQKITILYYYVFSSVNYAIYFIFNQIKITVSLQKQNFSSNSSNSRNCPNMNGKLSEVKSR